MLLHTFLTSALEEVEWSDSRPSRFIPGKDPDTLGMLVCERFGEKKNYFPLPGLESWATNSLFAISAKISV